jgi:heme exporter protein B
LVRIFMTVLSTLLRRELALAWGRGGGALYACAFYAGMATLLPLAAGSEPQRLAALAPGVAFAALALSSLLSLERLFERDFEDGALDLLALGPPPLEAICAAKCLAQWIASGLPLATLAPVIAIALGAAPALAPPILLTALLGGLGFAFTGGIGAALALGARRGGLLIAVIVLPLFAPPVIFGSGAIQAYATGLPWTPGFVFLAAYSLAAAALAPFAMAAGVRNALG